MGGDTRYAKAQVTWSIGPLAVTSHAHRRSSYPRMGGDAGVRMGGDAGVSKNAGQRPVFGVPLYLKTSCRTTCSRRAVLWKTAAGTSGWRHTRGVAVAFGGDCPPFEPARSSVAALPAGAGHPRWGFSTSALGSLR